MTVENPWLVDSIQAFSFLNCPECSFKAQDKNFFQGHALQNHPLSFEFFCTSSEKTKEIVTEIEKIESLENKTKEDKTLEQLMFPDSDSKTTNYIVTEVEKTGLLTNGTKDDKSLEELMFPDYSIVKDSNADSGGYFQISSKFAYNQGCLH
jgi:hypothetical protein